MITHLRTEGRSRFKTIAFEIGHDHLADGQSSPVQQGGPAAAADIRRHSHLIPGHGPVDQGIRLCSYPKAPGLSACLGIGQKIPGHFSGFFQLLPGSLSEIAKAADQTKRMAVIPAVF